MALTQMDYTGKGGSSVNTGTVEVRTSSPFTVDTGLGSALKHFVISGRSTTDNTLYQFVAWNSDLPTVFDAAFCYGNSGGGQHWNISNTSDSTRFFVTDVTDGKVTLQPPTTAGRYSLDMIWYAE